jgi:hypothetical protein
MPSRLWKDARGRDAVGGDSLAAPLGAHISHSVFTVALGAAVEHPSSSNQPRCALKSRSTSLCPRAKHAASAKTCCASQIASHAVARVRGLTICPRHWDRAHRVPTALAVSMNA